MHSQGLLRIDDHYYRELIFSLCRDFLRLESLARASSLSSGKMIDRHMTRKHGFAGWVLHHAGGGFRLINLIKATPNTTWSLTGLKCYLAGADSQHAVSHLSSGLSLARDFDQTFLLH
jgi:hypothetical protein